MEESRIKSLFTSQNKNLSEFLKKEFNYHGSYSVLSECKIKYGLIVDKIVTTSSGEFLCLIECKGSVGLTDFVRGLGQIAQYRQQILCELKHRCHAKCKAYLAYPNDVLKNSDISKLKYPEGTKSIIINKDNYTFDCINQNIKKYEKKLLQKTVSISPYYFRDNQFGELYITLNEFYKMGVTHRHGRISRTILSNIFKEINAPNPNNSRNAPITLSSCGLIDEENRLTSRGFDFVNLSYADFVQSYTYDFANTYIYSIYHVLNDLLINKDFFTRKDVKNELHKFWNLSSDQEIEFLTESKNRYIGSWLIIMRDSLHCIKFPEKVTKFSKSNMKILFNPTEHLKSLSDYLSKNYDQPEYVSNYFR